jgi:excinuclease UvrABC nuclease subunit
LVYKNEKRQLKKRWQEFDATVTRLLPDAPAVYCVKVDGVVIYVGSTRRLKTRFYEHKIRHGYGNNIILPWLSVSAKKAVTVKFKVSKIYGDWVMDEMRLIKKLAPIYNVMHKNPRKNYGGALCAD